MGIINSGLRAVKTGFNHIRPNSNFGTMAPVRKMARQSLIDAKHAVAEGVETGAITSADALADVTADVAERTGDLVEKSAKQMVDAEVEKVFAKSQKSWVGRHPILTGAAGLGGVAIAANALKGDNSVASPEMAYNQGSQQAEHDVMESMMAANINAAPPSSVMADDAAYMGTVEGQQRSASL